MIHPCTNAMVKDVATIQPEQTVEDALRVFKDKDIRNVPIVDEDGIFKGLFGLQQVMLNLLPKSATMEDGLESLNFIVDAAPGIAKRLRKIHATPVADLMNKDAAFIHPDTSTIEALLILAKKGSPVVVVEEETHKFLGVVSRQTLLKNLYEILEEVERNEKKSAL